MIKDQLSIIGFISAVFSTIFIRYMSNVQECVASNIGFCDSYDIESPQTTNEESTVINIMPKNRYSLGYDLEENDEDIVRFDWKRNISF